MMSCTATRPRNWNERQNPRSNRIRMDILVLLGGFTVLCALGVPVAYALGLSALLGALSPSA